MQTHLRLIKNKPPATLALVYGTLHKISDCQTRHAATEIAMLIVRTYTQCYQIHSVSAFSDVLLHLVASLSL
jgi:hypothetical protein